MKLYHLLWSWFHHESSKAALFFRTPLQEYQSIFDASKSNMPASGLGQATVPVSLLYQPKIALPDYFMLYSFIFLKSDSFSINAFALNKKAHSVWIMYERPQTAPLPEHLGYNCGKLEAEGAVDNCPAVFYYPQV